MKEKVYLDLVLETLHQKIDEIRTKIEGNEKDIECMIIFGKIMRNLMNMVMKFTITTML